MGILQDIESLKYRSALDLIKEEESYDKKRNVITGTDAFNMCYNRYKKMQEILLPLKSKLGDRIDVTDITFVASNEDENGIVVKYTKDNKLYILSIANLDYEDINVVASDIRVQREDFIATNRKIILRTFRNISNNSLDEDIIVRSTTGKFIIKDNCDSFTIKDSESKLFSIDTKYSIYEKNRSIINPQKLVCNFPKLKEMLENEENIKLIHDHIHIYENIFPSGLTKKLTYR